MEFDQNVIEATVKAEVSTLLNQAARAIGVGINTIKTRYGVKDISGIVDVDGICKPLFAASEKLIDPEKLALMKARKEQERLQVEATKKNVEQKARFEELKKKRPEIAGTAKKIAAIKPK